MLLKMKKLKYLLWQLSKATANIRFLSWFNDPVFKKSIFIRIFWCFPWFWKVYLLIY